MNRLQFDIAHRLAEVHGHAWALAVNRANTDGLLVIEEGREWSKTEEPLRDALVTYSQFRSGNQNPTMATIGAIEIITREHVFETPLEWILAPTEVDGNVDQVLGSKRLSWSINHEGSVVLHVLRPNQDMTKLLELYKYIEEKYSADPKKAMQRAILDAIRSTDVKVARIDVDATRQISVNIRTDRPLVNRELKVLLTSMIALTSANEADRALVEHARLYIAEERARRWPAWHTDIPEEERRWLGPQGMRHMIKTRAGKNTCWAVEVRMGGVWEIVGGPFRSNHDACQWVNCMTPNNPTGIYSDPWVATWRSILL